MPNTKNPCLLETLLAPGALRVLFQPIIELQAGVSRLHAVESLTRGPRDTTLEPADVLFEYVRRKHQEAAVDRACVAAVFEAVSQIPSALDFSINVHASTLSTDPEFLPYLCDVAEARSIALRRVTLEIVEHGPPWAGASFADALDALRHIGIGIALDDVGLGQSNYRMILDCRPDYFKIDRYFVQGCHGDFYRQAVLDSVARLAWKFGARVIAEGVEDVADLTTLTDLGIDLVQGHLFLEAVSPAELMAAEWLRVGTPEAGRPAREGP